MVGCDKSDVVPNSNSGRYSDWGLHIEVTGLIDEDVIFDRETHLRVVGRTAVKKDIGANRGARATEDDGAETMR